MLYARLGNLKCRDGVDLVSVDFMLERGRD